MQCPECGRERGGDHLRCPCGYSFAGKLHGIAFREGHKARVWPLASLSRRFWGQVIDGAVMVIPLLAAALLGGFTTAPGTIAAIAAYILMFAYKLLADGVLKGQSVGKLAMDTVVLDVVTGRRCTIGQSLARNIVGAVLAPLDWMFVFGTRRQRLGDRAAGTMVFHITAPSPGKSAETSRLPPG
jgi:uncharacterized RDD family membrane protein YckC